MNEFQRRKLDLLIRDSLRPTRLIGDEDLAEARGYITGLLEGGHISPGEFSSYHHQIMAAKRELFNRSSLGAAS